MDELPILIGAHYSVYTRIVHGALLLKSVPFSFQTLDIFTDGGKARARELGNPFEKIPILQHDSKSFYETRAILSYLNNNFKGTELFPKTSEQRAICEQLISIADQYIYPILVWKLYVPFSKDMHDDIPNEDFAEARRCLEAVENLLEEPWACGESITAADIYLEANLKLFLKAPFASSMLKDLPKLQAIIALYQDEKFFQDIPHEL